MLMVIRIVRIESVSVGGSRIAVFYDVDTCSLIN